MSIFVLLMQSTRSSSYNNRAIKANKQAAIQKKLRLFHQSLSKFTCFYKKIQMFS